jgi:hypothetical protein
MHATPRTFTAAWPLVIFLLLPASPRAETAVQDWVQRFKSGSLAPAMAVDGGNNVIVTAYGGRGYLTTKYSSAGVPLWAKGYEGGLAEGIDIPTAVAVDAEDSVIVAGHSRAGFFGGPARYATIKYSSAGGPLWTNLYRGPDQGDCQPCAVAVDGNNNVIVTGTSYSSGGSYDYATIKYSSDGLPLWTNLHNGPAGGFGLAAAMALDPSGNVIVTGWRLPSGGATVKYSSDGAPLWTNRHDWQGGDTGDAIAVAVDGSNNVIVTGTSYGSGGLYAYATIKYSSAGAPLWTNRYHGPGNGDDYARALAIDASNDVIVTGCSVGSGTTNDYATIKYSSAGVALWTNRYNGPANGDDCAPRRGRGRRQQRGRGRIFGGHRDQRGLSGDQVFEGRRATLDQPLQRARQRH